MSEFCTIHSIGSLQVPSSLRTRVRQTLSVVIRTRKLKGNKRGVFFTIPWKTAQILGLEEGGLVEFEIKKITRPPYVSSGDIAPSEVVTIQADAESLSPPEEPEEPGSSFPAPEEPEEPKPASSDKLGPGVST